MLQEQQQNEQNQEEEKKEENGEVKAEAPAKKKPMSKNEKKKWREKKNKMLKKIKEEINDDDAEMTQEAATALAKDWMELADIDGSGTIDIGEFKDFVDKLECNLSDEKVEAIFEAADKNNNKELDTEEFGASFFETIKSMKEVVEEDDDEDN